ncbi:hypothetical protein AHAS_Ahas19G0059600 [Arachis hypogaea]
MADNHDNDHNSSLANRTPNKDTDATSKDAPQNGGNKQPPNKKFWKLSRNKTTSEDKLLKLEADIKAKTTRSGHEDSPHKDQDPFTKEIMKAKVPKDFKAPDMTPYDGTSDPSHHLRNSRSRMYLTEASDAIHYSPSRRIKPNTLQAC